ncbi:MAG: magnesium-translocating P-type ATPase [Candidatus Bilamarchaeaceae archaeon]
MGVLDFLTQPKKKKYKPRIEKYIRLSSNIIETSGMEINALFEKLKTTPTGLTTREAKIRLRAYGENRAIKIVKKSKLDYLIEAYKNPLNLLLTLLAIVSYLTENIPSTIIILFMILVAVLLRFLQETKADEAAEKLKAMVRTTATVIRNGQKQEIPIINLVPGDVIYLSAGDIVPADVRLIESKDLFVNQCTLTGEALPVEKHAIPRDHKEVHSPFELQNMCFMGTNVESGTATAVIIATGQHTYFGAIAESLQHLQVKTEFDKGIEGFTILMIKFMLVMVPLIFLINAITKNDLGEALLFAIAVAVGLTPEMLPMIVSVNLAQGATKMAEKKVIVKRLNSIQNFGAIDILCTDKTGTLTQGRVILEKHIDIRGDENDEVLLYAYTNSYHQTGLKNMMDISVVEYGNQKNLTHQMKNYTKVDEIPWDFKRKRMSVIVNQKNEKQLLICKGSVEEIFEVTKNVEYNGKKRKPTTNDFEEMKNLVRSLCEDGFRVIAIAYKEVPMEKKIYSIQDENDLTLIGFVAFLDPPKESASEAVKLMKDNGIEVKILTGDNDLVTKKIARDIGMEIKGIVFGNDIDKMDDEELKITVEHNNIFVKLSPMHKERIIRALQKNKHTVGYLGDGINDAPALKAADVGISVDSAVDIAKETSDVILLEKNLLVLEDGIIEGRRVFGNIVKYVRMAASSNFGNMFSVVGASILLPFLPMLPLQILTNNLLYDLSQTAIPTDNVDKEWLSKPKKWNLDKIKNFIVFIGPVSSIFDYITYGFMWFVIGANTIEKAALFHTGWFIESLITQSLIIHIIRTNRIPFIESMASPQLLFASVAISVIAIALVFSPLAPALGFVELPLTYWIVLPIIIASYFVLTQLVKMWYIKNFENNEEAEFNQNQNK